MAQQHVLEACGLAVLVLLGWGSAFRRLCGFEVRTADDLFGAALEGWALLLGGLQVWHFFAPVNAQATALAAAVGLIGLGWTRHAWTGVPRRLWRNLPALVLVAIAALWLSGHALESPRHGDASGYYIPTTLWMQAFPVVTGLGNLSAPYAYNQSYFLYAAATAVGPFASRPWHLTNTILLMVLLARGLLGCWRLVSPWHRLAWNDLAYAFLLPSEIALTLGIWLTSQAPDTGIFLIGAALFGSLLHVAGSDARTARFHLLAVTLFACAGWTIKVSFAGMVAALLVVVPFGWWWRFRPPPSELGATLLAMGLIAAGMIGPWLGANVLMSGCPFFPSALGALDVPWRIQLNVQSWIESDKYVGPLSIVWKDPGWYLQRLGNYGWSDREVALPLLMGAAALPLVVVGWPWRTRTSLPGWIIVPPLVALVFAIRLTPMPRYAGATMWLLGITMTLVAIGGWLRESRVGRGLALAAIVVASVALASSADPLWSTLRDFDVPAHVATDPRVLASGLTVNVPRAIEACADAPLPCSPHPDSRLALRVAGDLGSGFFIDERLPPR